MPTATRLKFGFGAEVRNLGQVREVHYEITGDGTAATLDLPYGPLSRLVAAPIADSSLNPQDVPASSKATVAVPVGLLAGQKQRVILQGV